MPYKTKRIQRKRVKGWRMPANTIYVGRPSKWGNPYVITQQFFECYTVCEKNGSESVLIAWGIPKEMALEMVLIKYKEWLDANINYGKLKIDELRGKNLACFCPLSSPCHADILLELCKKPVEAYAHKKCVRGSVPPVSG